MHAHNNTIEEYLGAPKTVFVVPVYQRNYDWQEDNCKQLFSDIVRIIDSGKEHFLGTICFKVYSSHERALIDGQQRLTSISLMLKAMYDFDDDEENRDEITSQYLFNKGRGIDTEFLKYKLHLNKRDDIVYHVLLDNEKDMASNKLTNLQKKSRVYQNYLCFYNLVAGYTANGGSSGDILEALRSLTIIELEIEQENPQEIFESLNSTGMDLTNVDLLRNYFLMQFGHALQTQLYENYWSQIEDYIGVDRMEQFFVDYLVFRKRSDSITINGRRNHIHENTLYYAFKDYYKGLPQETDYDKTLYCFKDMKACAEIYQNFIFDDDIIIDKESPMHRKLYFLLSINDSSKARSLLLYIFDIHKQGLIDNDMLNSAVDGISSLTFRARICKAQGINRQFAGNVMQRLETIEDYSQFTDMFWRAITAGKGSYAFPSDAEFKDALENKDIYNALRSRGTKYFLYTLEAYSPYPKGLPPFDDESLSVEHIMPRTLTTSWRNYLSKASLEAFDTSLHRLGNLALTNYNPEMSNKDFDEKKAIYANEDFFYTRTIVNYDKWQSEQIKKRSQELAQEALKIWQLPAQYQNDRPISESLHTIDEDPSTFSFTKPSMLFIGDNEYAVNYWGDCLPILCRLLENENHEAFLEIANPNKISAFGLEDDTHVYSTNNAYALITDNIYVRAFQSARGVVENMLRVTKAFDVAAGTEYTGNVLFSLK